MRREKARILDEYLAAAARVCDDDGPCHAYLHARGFLFGLDVFFTPGTAFLRLDGAFLPGSWRQWSGS